MSGGVTEAVVSARPTGLLAWCVRRAVPALVIGALVSTLVVAAAYRVGPERFWLFSLLQYAPFPVVLLPLVALVVLALPSGRLWVALAVLTLAVAVIEVMGLELHTGETAQGNGHLRVLTFNVKDYITLRQKDGRLDLANEIARHDPDIFVLQDARSFQQDRIDAAFARQVFAGRQFYTFGQYVVASRFPMRDCRNGWISFRDEPHTYVACVVTVHNRDVDLITTHFMTPRFGLAATRFNPVRGIGEWTGNVNDRMTQASLLSTDVKSLTRPVILAGDLNAPEQSLVVRTLLNTGLRDAFSVAGRGFGYTWGHSLRFQFAFLRIDHILVSSAFRVTRTVVGDDAGSAHRPVIADLELREDAQ